MTHLKKADKNYRILQDNLDITWTQRGKNVRLYSEKNINNFIV